MDKERARRLFLTAFFLFALANGLSGSIISNYFKDVFQVDSVQRGLLEIPRELPGVVGVFVIAALPSLGNVSLSVLGFALYCVGLLVLGLFSPGYFVMQLFVFTYSLGDHMVMPIRDAIAMDLADEGKTGTFLGRYRGMMTLGSMLASALVFVGFRVGFFYFRTGVIPSFCAALVFLIVALALLCRLRKTLPALDVRKRSSERRRLPVRRREDMVHAQAEGKVFHHVRGRLAQLAHEHDVDGIEMVGEENENVGGERGGHAAPAAQRAVHDAGSGPRGEEKHTGDAGGLQHEPLLHTVPV